MDENEEENDGEDLVDEKGLLVFDRLPLALWMSDVDDTELLKLPRLLPLRLPVRERRSSVRDLLMAAKAASISWLESVEAFRFAKEGGMWCS